MDWTARTAREHAAVTAARDELARRQAELEQARQRLGQASSTLAAATARHAHAARMAAAQRSGAAAVRAAGPVRVARTGRVATLLAAASAPLAPRELRTLLIPGEPSVTTARVSATLDQLRRTGRARRVGRGQWVAAVSGRQGR